MQMPDLTVEEVDEIIERLLLDFELIRLNAHLSAVLVSAMNIRRSYTCIFFRFRKVIPVVGTQQNAMLYADMGAN